MVSISRHFHKRKRRILNRGCGTHAMPLCGDFCIEVSRDCCHFFLCMNCPLCGPAVVSAQSLEFHSAVKVDASMEVLKCIEVY